LLPDERQEEESDLKKAEMGETLFEFLLLETDEEIK